MKTSIHPRCLVQQNARRLRELRAQIGEGYELSRKDPAAAKEHTGALHEFSREYDRLAFPGGWNAALQRLKSGDKQDVEAALAFLEVRPYFFRSQYIWKKLSRLLGHVPLTKAQQERYEAVRTEEKLRRRKNAGGYSPSH